MSRKFDAIIITSDEPYGEMWHTQLIYADFLSTVTQVFYISPPGKWSPVNLFKRHYKKKTLSPSLDVINYLNIYPSRWNERNDRFLSKFVFHELKKIEAKNILVWHFDSFRSSFKECFLSQQIELKRIYHVIDPFYHNPLNDWLARHADILVLTSERNKAHYSAFAEKTQIIPQALDLTLHKHYLEKDPKFALPEKFAVLLGTLSNDVDIALLHKLMSSLEMELVIIGKVTELSSQNRYWEKLTVLPNVHYKGMLAPEDFYPILKRAFAGLIVYTEQKQKQVSSPLKVLNYLVAGLPVITNLNCEIDELLGEAIYDTPGAHAMSEAIKKALRNELNFNKEAVNNYLNQISLPNIIDALFSRL